MRVQRTAFTAPLAATAKPAATQKAESRDAVTLSPVAKSASSGKGAAVDEATLQRLKGEIEAGTYKVDLDQLASEMLDAEPGLGGA